MIDFLGCLYRTLGPNDLDSGMRGLEGDDKFRHFIDHFSCFVVIGDTMAETEDRQSQHASVRVRVAKKLSICIDSKTDAVHSALVSEATAFDTVGNQRRK
ncbi:hypothetical protein OHR68_07950 [Spirillospora sp. NBC_00431]